MDPVTTLRQGSLASTEAEAEDTSLTTLSTSIDSLPRLPTIKFTTLETLAQAINETAGDVLYVEDVSQEDFTAIKKFRESTRRKYRFKHYSSNSQLLIITIPTEPHELAHREIYTEVTGQIRDMGLRHEWYTVGGTTYKHTGINGATSGEGDSCGKPHMRGGPLLDWPTLVIEAGYSQSIYAVRQTMRWWFNASNHQVKIVLLVKIHTESDGRIQIEKWQERQPDGRITRSRGILEPRLMQDIKIIRTPANANLSLPSSYTITRGDLRLEFEDLFLRPAGPGEGDIIIKALDLQYLGATIAQHLYR